MVEQQDSLDENKIDNNVAEPTLKDTTSESKRFIKNIIIVLISNLISVLSGVLVGFIIPKIMGVSEYGYYKTFTLYSSYIGILHFGFIDGIYLKFAGKKYEELDKNKFRCYTRFLFMLELAVSLIVLMISFTFIGSDYFLIILFVSLNVLATNITTYFEFISQVTMKFKRITFRNVIRCTLNIISVVVLFLLYKFNDVVIYNTIYVLIVLSINYLLAIWYIISYRDIAFGKANKISEEKNEIKFFFKIGIPLLLANLVGQLIFIADQQVVNILFDNDTYSTYAFAYNMINLITVATSAISVVLYPTLKKLNNETITNNYSNINAYLLIFVSFCLIAYYPFKLIIDGFLPKYGESLSTFMIILPGILISSSISVVKYNCYKTFNKVNNYFYKSIIVLILSIIANIVVYLIFKNTMSISMVSIFVLLFWYIMTEYYFIKEYKVKWVSNLIYMIIVICGFYGSTFIPNIYLGFGAYFLFLIVVTLITKYKELIGLLKMFKLKRS